MDLPFNYVAPARDIPTPTREEIIKGGFLRRQNWKLVQPLVPLIKLDVLAAPEGIFARGGRWKLPAGELFFATEGLAFITLGKRIGAMEQYLGGTLFWAAKNVGMKFVEPFAGKVIGEELVSTLSDDYEWYEVVEALDAHQEGLENRESLFLPINRIVSLSLPFEPNNMYGIVQLDLVLEIDDGKFETFNFLAREEDGNVFRGLIPFLYFLRLSYEQYHFQTSLFRRHAKAPGDIPQNASDWTLKNLSFKPNIYQRTKAALDPGAPSVDSIRLEALVRSRNVISQLRAIDDQKYNIGTPWGKLFELALPEGPSQ